MRGVNGKMFAIEQKQHSQSSLPLFRGVGKVFGADTVFGRLLRTVATREPSLKKSRPFGRVSTIARGEHR
jgi:hypothetical protein